MKSSRLHLEEFFIKRLNLEWVTSESGKNADAEEYPSDLGIDYELARHDEDPRCFRLLLNVESLVKEDYTGLKMETEIVGFFSFPDDTEEDEMQYLVRINGASMLYGILRGQIAMVTGSFPTGKMNLPPVVMQEVLPEIDRAKEEASKEAAKESNSGEKE